MARSKLHPDLPTISDFLPGFEVNVWFGVGARRNTPAEIVDRLNKEVNIVLTDSKIVAQLAELGGAPMPMAPAELEKRIAADTEKWGKLIADETEKWAKVIRAANIKAE